MSLKVHHLSCGTMCPRGAYFVHGSGSIFGRARIVCHVMLVETNDGLALVDTGIGLQDVRDPLRLGKGFLRRSAPKLDEAETAIAQVRALGLDVDDVRHLIPTHLDVDHAGGLPDFPNARVHVMRAELDALPIPTSTDRYRPAHFAHGPKWSPYDEAGESWFGFDAVKPLIEGETDVLLVPLFGHTAGLAAVAVKTGNGLAIARGRRVFQPFGDARRKSEGAVRARIISASRIVRRCCAPKKSGAATRAHSRSCGRGHGVLSALSRRARPRAAS